jgi:hypothetical protein
MRRLAIIPILCVMALGVALYGRNKSKSSPIVGTWTCVAHGGENGDIPFTLYIEHSSKGYTGTVSAEQGDTDLTSVMFNDDHLKITIDTGDSNYLLTGTLADGKLSGEWSRDGEKKGAWEGKE